MIKKIFLILGIFIFLILGNSFIQAAEETLTEDYGEVSSEVGDIICPECPAENFVVENVILEKEGALSTLTFKNENSRIEVEGNVFENIKTDSNIVFNEKGEIEEAELHISDEKSSIFKIGESGPYEFPAGSVVLFKDGKLTVENLGENEFKIPSNFGNLEEMTFEGRGITLVDPDGTKIPFWSGERIHYDGKNYFFKEGEIISYGGMEVQALDRINFYLDGEPHIGEAAVSFNPEGGVSWSCGDNPNIGKIIFTGTGYNQNTGELINYDSMHQLKDSEGRFLADVLSGNAEVNKNKNLFEISPFEKELAKSRLNPGKEMSFEFVEPNSAVNFFSEENDLNPSIPTVNPIEGGYKIESGSLILINDGNDRTIKSLGEGNLKESLEVVIYDKTHPEIDRRFWITENSGIVSTISEKGITRQVDEEGRIGDLDIMLTTNHFESEDVLYTFEGIGDSSVKSGFVDTKKRLSEYNSLFGDFLKDKYSRKGFSEKEINTFFISSSESTLEEEEYAKRFSLSFSDIKNYLERYNNANPDKTYSVEEFSNLRYLNGYNYLYEDTRGENEQDLDYIEQAWGYREKNSMSTPEEAYLQRIKYRDESIALYRTKGYAPYKGSDDYYSN